MFSWITGIFGTLKSFITGKGDGNITIYFLVLMGLVTILVMSTPKLLSMIGYVSQKDKLLMQVTDQANVIGKLTEENKKLASELLKYQQIVSVNEESINKLKDQRASDANAAQVIIASKEAKIKEILDKANVNKIPVSCVKYKDATAVLPKEKIDQISKMQIDSIWSNYETSINNK